MTVKEYNKNYYQMHKKERKIQDKIYRNANKDKFSAQQKAYRETHKEKRKKYADAYYKIHKKEMNRQSRTYYIANKEKIDAYRNNWKKVNSEKVRIYSKRGYDKNVVKITACTKKWIKKKYKTDSKFRLNHTIGSAVRKSLKGNKNGRHWESLVGYTLDDLKKHLEKLFTVGMLWENYGLKGWTIDHKIPISVFNFTIMRQESPRTSVVG